MKIAFRVWAGAFTTVAAISTLSAVLVYGIATYEKRADAGIRLREVLSVTSNILSTLTTAETGQRGFLLTGREMYLEPYTSAHEHLDQDFAQLSILVSGNQPYEKSVTELRVLANERLAELGQAIDLRRGEGLNSALKLVENDQGQLMDNIRRKVASLVSSEQLELTTARTALEARLSRLRLIGEGGGAFALCLVLFFAWNTTAAVGSSVRQLLSGIRSISDGDFEKNIELEDRTEFAPLAGAFNRMTSLLGTERRTREAAEQQLEDVNQALRRRNNEQSRYTNIVESISRMTRRMQGCRTEAELAEVVRCFLPQMMPGVPGMLLLMSNSQNMLREITDWGDPQGSLRDFPPTDCWAFRRGQAHWKSASQADVSCTHAIAGSGACCGCIPLMAQGDIIGLLYLESPEPTARDVPAPDLETLTRDLDTGIENIALALVNLRLRETLRNQSIRDPLTGLFNRRYLHETFELDLARAQRGGQSIACIMIDADHFKRFNDTFGHDAGDLILREIARLFSAHMRHGDIACRYGGEEFTLVLPEMAVADALASAEAIRMSAKALTVTHRGQSVGAITLSLGVASYPADGDTADAVLAAADRALLRAKSEGRDRVVSAT